MRVILAILSPAVLVGLTALLVAWRFDLKRDRRRKAARVISLEPDLDETEKAISK